MEQFSILISTERGLASSTVQRVQTECLLHQNHNSAKTSFIKISQMQSFIERSIVRIILHFLPEMEHKLRVQREVVRELEAAWILLIKVSKLLTQSDQHSI